MCVYFKRPYLIVKIRFIYGKAHEQRTGQYCKEREIKETEENIMS